MDQIEQAVSCFDAGFSCAQAVFSTYAPQFGLERETALRVAGAFGGGMARLGRTCGAVTGALMVIGLKFGKTRAEDKEAKERCYQLAREFIGQFEARHGSTICKELLGYDLNIPAERAAASEHGLFETLCPRLVRDAAEILARIV
ncbi:MAG: C_GCAxxG_C_C family protein [Anaerolineae bacterium]|nr:C_GCAxxG_C_C family protein [Anaerolineae bacterium]